MTETSAAVIADIVGSRQLKDRARAQQLILETFAAVAESAPPCVPAWATVGDEFQLVHRTWPEALRATLLIQLSLEAGVELRFGIGLGEHRTVPGATAEDAHVFDGSAWYRAREAVIQAAQRTGAATSFVGADVQLSSAIEAALVLRDHVVGRLKARERRVARGLLSGNTQTEIATQERITQSAVSQTVHRAGIDALLRVDAALQDLASRPSALRTRRAA
ncbi:MAG: SatD family protein [Micrococcus sp.]|nr:SatD family protein [Micrococcus sp.]